MDINTFLYFYFLCWFWQLRLIMWKKTAWQTTRTQARCFFFVLICKDITWKGDLWQLKTNFVRIWKFRGSCLNTCVVQNSSRDNTEGTMHTNHERETVRCADSTEHQPADLSSWHTHTNTHTHAHTHTHTHTHTPHTHICMHKNAQFCFIIGCSFLWINFIGLVTT